jgi:hypothetical protein
MTTKIQSKIKKAQVLEDKLEHHKDIWWKAQFARRAWHGEMSQNRKFQKKKPKLVP